MDVPQLLSCSHEADWRYEVTRMSVGCLGLMIAAFGCADSSGTGGAGGTRGDDNPFEGYESELYAGLDNWLCHPGLAEEDDLCMRDLDATLVDADGSTQADPHVVAEDPEFDCFYVYPTVSVDPAGNSDLDPNDEERFVILNQAARFTSTCRVFAPIYRQGTLTALLGLGDFERDRELAYGDVLDAFGAYMANDNDGRGVILVGHSQGAGLLARLLAEVVEESDYLHDHMIAAYLAGATLAVPEGADVGGDFQRTPLCRSSDETGCLVTFASFRSTEPPEDETALFAKTDEPGTEAACNNPAALAGDQAIVTSYFSRDITGAFAVALGATNSPWADPDAENVTTPFFRLPGLVRAECVRRDAFHYLEITVLSDPEDPRTDDISGDFQPGWGLHLADVTLVMGDLIALAEQQAEAYLGR